MLKGIPFILYYMWKWHLFNLFCVKKQPKIGSTGSRNAIFHPTGSKIPSKQRVYPKTGISRVTYRDMLDIIKSSSRGKVHRPGTGEKFRRRTQP